MLSFVLRSLRFVRGKIHAVISVFWRLRFVRGMIHAVISVFRSLRFFREMIRAFISMLFKSLRFVFSDV
jgi:uncharacterized membrane protein YqaE (UPF0057 family)